METLLQDALARGSLVAIAVAFIAGLLSVATPCVLPMLPITLGVIGASKAATRKRALLVSACYVAGIVCTFTLLGLVAALTGSLFGAYLGSPYVALALAAFFLVLAANSFELFQFSLPSGLSSSLARVGGTGPVGALAMGLVAGVIASPCVGAVLAGILAYVSTTGNALWGAALLACYGLGFGLPFLIVGAFALRLPKGGPWLKAAKFVFGLALCAGAAWFVRMASPTLAGMKNITVAMWLVFLGAFWVVAALRVAEKSASSRASAAWRALGSLGALTLAFSMLLCLNEWLPRAPVPSASAVAWCEERPGASCLPATCQGHTLTVVDFGAPWCPACVEMEETTFSDPAISDALRPHGRVRVNVDENDALSTEYRVRNIPTIVFLDRSCNEIGRGVGYIDADDFRAVLREAESRAAR